MTKRPPEPLSKREALMLVHGANTRRKTGVRNAAVIALMWRSQLRIGETLDLRPCDCEGDRIRILHGKGSKSRVVGVDQGTKDLIDTWMLIRPKSDYLFCTMKGTKIDSSYYRRLFKKLQIGLGIIKRCHPHGMRHTGASELAKENVPLILISQQLGHSNISTTDAYIRHLCPEEVISVIKDREW